MGTQRQLHHWPITYTQGEPWDRSQLANWRQQANKREIPKARDVCIYVERDHIEQVAGAIGDCQLRIGESRPEMAGTFPKSWAEKTWPQIRGTEGDSLDARKALKWYCFISLYNCLACELFEISSIYLSTIS